MTRILALSGSLRARSTNAMLLRAAARVAPRGITVQVHDELGALPLFNPDLEASNPPAVARLREAIIGSDALLIASPEYAHGVSGVIKNALDWMVGNESFIDKPVALLNASPRATIARDALLETLRTMSARIVEPACATIAVLGTGLSEDDLVGRADFVATLRGVLESLRQASSPAP